MESDPPSEYEGGAPAKEEAEVRGNRVSLWWMRSEGQRQLVWSPLKLFYRFENFGGVALGGRLVPDSRDASVGTDQKRGAHDTEE